METKKMKLNAKFMENPEDIMKIDETLIEYANLFLDLYLSFKKKTEN